MSHQYLEAWIDTLWFDTHSASVPKLSFFLKDIGPPMLLKILNIWHTVGTKGGSRVIVSLCAKITHSQPILAIYHNSNVILSFKYHSTNQTSFHGLNVIPSFNCHSIIQCSFCQYIVIQMYMLCVHMCTHV